MKGAELLDTREADEDSVFDVIAYPLSQNELTFFVDTLPAVEAAVRARQTTWRSIQTAENPIQAIRRHRAWRDAGVNCEDFMAVFIKLNFIYEYLSGPTSMEDAKANLSELEGRIGLINGDPELKEAKQSLEFMTKVVDDYASAGSFDLYKKNKAALDAAIERFKSIGE